MKNCVLIKTGFNQHYYLLYVYISILKLIYEDLNHLFILLLLLFLCLCLSSLLFDLNFYSPFEIKIGMSKSRLSTIMCL